MVSSVLVIGPVPIIEDPCGVIYKVELRDGKPSVSSEKIVVVAELVLAAPASNAAMSALVS